MLQAVVQAMMVGRCNGDAAGSAVSGRGCAVSGAGGGNGRALLSLAARA